MSGTSASSSPLYAYKEGYGELAWAMRESAHRILYTVVHSNAMNGITSGTQIRVITPWWQEVLSELRVELGIIFAASALIAFGLYFIVNKRQKAALQRQIDPPKKVVKIELRWNDGK
jgi:beta-glucosidase